jgi:hypothetical protein
MERLCGRTHNCSYVAKLVMWRWPEQPPVPSNGTPFERHISDPVPQSDGSPPSSRPTSTTLLPGWSSTQRLTHELALICRSNSAPTLVVAGNTCPVHARALRVREEMVMWRLGSTKG